MEKQVSSEGTAEDGQRKGVIFKATRDLSL